ncbi:FecR family protein [Catenovulum sediminis]|uniref:FecR domain-containing protein n=1 Tax=Catenovulum sediminis TaxID=1740262 RepID=A0ABV1RIG1_9ALTE
MNKSDADKKQFLQKEEHLLEAILLDPALQEALESESIVDEKNNVVALNAFTSEQKCRQVHGGKSSYWRTFSVAASVMLMVVFGLTSLYKNDDQLIVQQTVNQQEYSSGIAQTKKVTLADESVITLNAASKIKVEYTDQQRNVTLLAGEAYFNVAKNADKPFNVITQNGRITVLGTQFNVDQTRDSVAVNVYEGKVEVKDINDMSQQLLAGDRVAFTSDGSEPKSQFNLKKGVDWQQGQLRFTNVKLVKVIEKLNRYTEQTLYLDPVLNHKLVTATFKLDDMEGNISLLRELYQLDALTTGKSRYLTPKI